MDYSKPTAGDGHKTSPTFGGTTIIPPADDRPQPVPPPLHPQRGHGAPPGQWNTGLFECHTDIPNCCVTFLCPCITFGQVAEIVDRGSTSCGASGALYTLIALLTGWPCMYSCFYRTKMRRQLGLPEYPLPDILVHGCCELCALCQEYRELKDRGFDMTLGWDGNVDRQNQGMTMAPVVQERMSR